MASKWEKLKKTVKDEFTTAATLTRKYARIGKVKFGKMNINSSMSSTFEELGIEVYNQISDGTKGEISHSKKVKNLITKINDLKQFIENKDQEIEALKHRAVPQASADLETNNPTDVKARESV